MSIVGVFNLFELGLLHKWAPIAFMAAFVAFPCLLGFLFAMLHAKARFKPLWATFWIITATSALAEVVALLAKLVPLKHSFERPVAMLLLILAAVAFFIFCSWLGRKFKVRKVICWLSIPLIFIIPYFICNTLNQVAAQRPFGFVDDYPVPPFVSDSAKGFDYGIDVSEAFEATVPEYRIRVKGDSAYSQTNYDVHVTYIGDSPVPEDDIIDSSPWTLMDANRTAMVKKLIESIQDYDMEYVTEIRNGRHIQINLYDLKKGKARILDFPDTEAAKAHDAVEIVDMVKRLWMFM